MLFKEAVAIYCENDMKQTCSVGRMQNLCMLKQMVHVEAMLLKGLNYESNECISIKFGVECLYSRNYRASFILYVLNKSIWYFGVCMTWSRNKEMTQYEFTRTDSV